MIVDGELAAGSQASKGINSRAVGKRRQIPVSPIPAANVSAVPQRSPLRYPGGKTWLIPHVRAWLKRISPSPRLLVEPFAGGGIVSLTAVMENLVGRCLMVERDHDVAAFWHAALRHGPKLCEKIMRFNPTREAVARLSRRRPANILEHGFRTLVLNRTRYGGILASGAASIDKGEEGKGIKSRWYPNTLVKRLGKIAEYAGQINFCETNGLQLMETLLGNYGPNTAVFVDPPYTAGEKRAGHRLYKETELDHARLFGMLTESHLNFLMTYDYSQEILSLIRKHNFHVVRVAMKKKHSTPVHELIITPQPVFRKGRAI